MTSSVTKGRYWSPSSIGPRPIYRRHGSAGLRARRRNGAYGWGVFEDSANEGRMLETFLVESWLEHLRQRERVTNEDRVLQDLVNQFQTEDSTPKITHFIGRERD